MTPDWHLQQDESGDVFIHFPNEFHNLGPRDEVLTRFADFFRTGVRMGQDSATGRRIEEIEVTPAMVAAGCRELRLSRPSEDDWADIVSDIFLAMLAEVDDRIRIVHRDGRSDELPIAP